MILATAKVLQDARHAVLRTLYSRAHRVVWDVISYLLRGLCESLSLDLFFAMPVSVLACPALELLVLLEQQLEGLADDVGSVRVDELGVLVEVMPDLSLQAHLNGRTLRSLRRCSQSCPAS